MSRSGGTRLVRSLADDLTRPMNRLEHKGMRTLHTLHSGRHDHSVDLNEMIGETSGRADDHCAHIRQIGTRVQRVAHQIGESYASFWGAWGSPGYTDHPCSRVCEGP